MHDTTACYLNDVCSWLLVDRCKSLLQDLVRNAEMLVQAGKKFLQSCDEIQIGHQHLLLLACV